MSIRDLTAWEFFAGGGLAGLGLAGFRIAFANDIDAAKARSFVANHPGTPFRQADVWSLDVADLPGRPDLMWASSPCQDLSLAGARRGLEARRSGAFWGFWRLVQGLNAEGRGPRAVVLENVAGLLSSNGGRDLEAVCAAMAEAGYRVGALELDAAAWLPQSRPRLFVVALTPEAAADRAAAGPVAGLHSARLIEAQAAMAAPVRAAWAWWRLPLPPRRNLDLTALLDPTAEGWLDARRTQVLLERLSPLHRQRLDQARAAGSTTAAGYVRIRREDGRKVQRFELRFDGLAGCLRTPAGGSSRQYVLQADAGRVRIRRLSGREAARLMGVGDDYVLPASESAALKLMGDAVAVPVVRALSEGLLAPALRGERRAA